MSASEHDLQLPVEHVIKNGKKASTPRRKRVIGLKSRRTDDTSNSLDDVDIKPELDLDGNIIPLLEASGRLLEETGDITAASHEVKILKIILTAFERERAIDLFYLPTLMALQTACWQLAAGNWYLQSGR
jgi:hypothetical protein